MAGQIKNGLGLKSNFTDGVDGWGDDLNNNLNQLDAVVNGGVIDFIDLASLPTSAAFGDRYIVNETGDIAIWEGAWIKWPARDGYRVYKNSSAQLYFYNGSEWAEFVGGGGASINPVAAKFSGDGSTTTFTLVEDPVNAINVIVGIGGAFQDFDSYTVTPTSITFSEAPPTGTDNIQVRYGVITAGSGEANTASNLGAGAQLFKQKTGSDLEFRSLVAGTGVTISENSDNVTINSSGGGGGVTVLFDASPVSEAFNTGGLHKIGFDVATARANVSGVYDDPTRTFTLAAGTYLFTTRIKIQNNQGFAGGIDVRCNRTGQESNSVNTIAFYDSANSVADGDNFVGVGSKVHVFSASTDFNWSVFSQRTIFASNGASTEERLYFMITQLA